MSHRKQQIEAALQRALSQILAGRLSDPRLTGMISILKVELVSKMQEARVHISVMPPHHHKRVLAALTHAGGRIHALLRPMLTMRTIPRISFTIDHTLKKQDEIFDAIRQGLDRDQALAAKTSSPQVDQPLTPDVLDTDALADAANASQEPEL